MEKKRAQVGIITVVLIILISLVAVLIIWNVVSMLVSEKSNVNTKLLSIELGVRDVVMFVTGSSKISVYRGAGGGEINSLKFVFYDEDGNSEVRNKEGLLELETKVYSFKPLGISEIETVSVYPMTDDAFGREFKSDVSKVIEMPYGLVSWWRFNDLTDFISKNNGRVVGDVFIDERLVLGSGYFSVSDDLSLDLDEGLTISAWVKTEDDGVILEKGKNYGMFLKDRKVVFSYGNREFESFDELNDDWNHVVVSVDFNGLFKMFVNGEIASDFVNLNVSPEINDEDLRIGEDFKGEIDEVMIFNKSLSVEQVRGLYEFGKNVSES